jgi:hypothetical protein
MRSWLDPEAADERDKILSFENVDRKCQHHHKKYLG